MNVVLPDPVDQALFGYADGHRQIATSYRLPPKDLFLLSSASDLASGARLGDDDSYLTGLPLPESKRYALLRTWAAPEMPRPGCVWSHTLLLDSRTMSSIASFSEFLKLFRRPVGRDTSNYGKPLNLASSLEVGSGPVDLISAIIDGYYSDRIVTLSSSENGPKEIERSILAVWSQQWPRLRTVFSFCTADLNERRRSEGGEYDIQVSALGEAASSKLPRWVSFGAIDAAENRVTPLRRFLWRYGRDLSASRRQYKMLVDLFEQTEGANEISGEAALTVFNTLQDPSEGAVLKRDILGIGPSSPRLIAAISAVDFLQLMTSQSLPEMPTASQVERRLEELTSREIGKVARYYDTNKEALSPWKNPIYGAIIALADKSLVMSEYPTDMIADVLLARDDLIDGDTLPLAANDVLPRLLKDDAPAQVCRAVIDEMLRRDMGDLEGTMISSKPDLFFQSAVEAYCENRIDQSWLGRLPHHSGAIFAGSWLSQLQSTIGLAAALAILRYPRNLANSSTEIAQRLSELHDDAQGDERTNMQAALLRAAVDIESAQSWSLISVVLPELRTTILKGVLPRTADTILSKDLPSFYSAGYWDLNKRILLSLSKLYRVFPNDDALHRLALNPAEQEIVLAGEERSMKYPFAKLWDWL
ncbi:hypothetical protein ACFSOZ_33990 [Mesorhizobium newzealandense]|uniref:Uncharacterized protein n=1 Tax=Mesorhizobium newzealandense TaxID=1300302 RepID=A0ABW4UML2_9HYPH